MDLALESAATASSLHLYVNIYAHPQQTRQRGRQMTRQLTSSGNLAVARRCLSVWPLWFGWFCPVTTTVERQTRKQCGFIWSWCNNEATLKVFSLLEGILALHTFSLDCDVWGDSLAKSWRRALPIHHLVTRCWVFIKPLNVRKLISAEVSVFLGWKCQFQFWENLLQPPC